MSTASIDKILGNYYEKKTSPFETFLLFGLDRIGIICLIVTFFDVVVFGFAKPKNSTKNQNRSGKY